MSNSKLVSGIKNGGSGYSKGYGQKGTESYGRPVNGYKIGGPYAESRK